MGIPPLIKAATHRFAASGCRDEAVCGVVALSQRRALCAVTCAARHSSPRESLSRCAAAVQTAVPVGRPVGRLFGDWCVGGAWRALSLSRSGSAACAEAWRRAPQRRLRARAGALPRWRGAGGGADGRMPGGGPRMLPSIRCSWAIMPGAPARRAATAGGKPGGKPLSP